MPVYNWGKRGKNKKNRVQIFPGQFTIIQISGTKIFKFSSSGIRGVYQGVVPTILKQGSNQAIRFFVMESLKNWYREGDPKKPVPVYIVGAFGAFAGACSVFGNTPIDVIKTRLQVSDI